MECNACANINVAFMHGSRDQTPELSIIQHHACPVQEEFQSTDLFVPSEQGSAPRYFNQWERISDTHTIGGQPSQMKLSAWQHKYNFCGNAMQCQYLRDGILNGFRIVNDDTMSVKTINPAMMTRPILILAGCSTRRESKER